MTANIVVRTGPGETRYALTVGGVLTRQMVRRDSDAALLGTIYRGQIVKLHKGLNAAFVDLGDGREGFLSAQDAQYFDGAREKPRPIGEVYTEGESVLVQVTREASDGKGPKLTGRLSLVSPNFINFAGGWAGSPSKPTPTFWLTQASRLKIRQKRGSPPCVPPAVWGQGLKLP